MSELFFADLVRERASGSGTGPVTLTGALPGYPSFAAVVPGGAHFHYSLSATHGDAWEVGIGSLDGEARLVREPLSSSAGGGAVDFAAGEKTVSLTVAAAWFAARDDKAAHSHAMADVDGLPDALGNIAAQIDAKQPAGNYATAEDIDILVSALDGKQPSGSYAPASHEHEISDVTGLATALDGKQVAGDYASADHAHAAYLTDAPADTYSYVRKDGAWAVAASGGVTAMPTGGTLTAVGWAFDGDPNTGFRQASADSIEIVTGGARRATLTNTGFGIGPNVTPAAVLHVNSGNQNGAIPFLLEGGDGSGTVIKFQRGGANPEQQFASAYNAYSYYTSSGTRSYFKVGVGVGVAAIGPSTGSVVLEAGAFRGEVDNAMALGTASQRWTAVYAASGTINTSDEREKTGWRERSAAEQAAGLAIVSELGFFQFNDSIAEKGEENARLHFGVRAQRVWDVMAAHGLVDAIDAEGRPGSTPYAFLCYDEWPQETGEDGEVLHAAGNRYGVRTDQLALFLIACLARTTVSSVPN